MIRIDAVWLSATPQDLRAGMESLLAQVVKVFGEARPHEAYLFANRRANRIKILVHDGFGLWLAVRRLNQGHFVWPRGTSARVSLTRTQFDALILGLPWQHLGEGGVIRIL
jgi:transposase